VIFISSVTSCMPCQISKSYLLVLSLASPKFACYL
jgi:hypothetical protein